MYPDAQGSAAHGELLAAFRAYEQALAADDVAALGRWFSTAPGTLRAEGAVVLSGHEAIADFRRGRGGAPPRTVERLHLVPLGADAAVLTAETRRADGSHGLQTQVWQRGPEGWRIRAAHVSATPPAATPRGPAAAPDPAVWRVTGSPLAAGTPGGPLAGKRLAVKDLFAVAGQATGAGNPAWLATSPAASRHAAAVGALLRAGADVVGLAQTDELAFGLAGGNAHYGTPANPAAPGRLPGGSSSGPAAAVAAGLADLGLATDTAGSIRVPASYCGLYGWRPTHGAVSTEGLVPLAPAFDTAGLLAADPELLRAGALALLEGAPGPAAGAEAAPITSLAVDERLTALAEPETRASFAAACRALALRTGLPLTRLTVPGAERLDAWFAAFRTVQAAQAWARHGAWIERHEGALAPAVAARFAAGRSVTEEQRAAGEEELAQAGARLRAALGPGSALLLPATSGPAPLVSAPPEEVEAVRAATLRLTHLASLAGLPAVAAPWLRVRGLPAGLCLAGPPGADLPLLGLAARAARPTPPGGGPR
ncbi:amidase [Streptomyces hoynatensis]|uniref:Amidase n=1 Tax=Streptomyces hoynatensis TaxID=1141874 RepID=A0A3A9YU61_9ACTN|nr:amidase [Streptomyces hoynatensis]RKN39044.1 amidase [Streptomyces hoynatensis]